MKDLDAKIAAVQQAEAECNRQRRDTDLAWNGLKAEIRRTATPARIVVSGLALGFASGFTTTKAAGAASGKLLAGPIFSMLLDTVLPAALAGFTAMQAADETADGEDASGDEDAAAEVAAMEAEAAEEAPPPKPRPRRRRRVDSAA